MANLADQYKELLDLGAIDDVEYQKLIEKNNRQSMQDKSMGSSSTWDLYENGQQHSGNNQGVVASTSATSPKKRTVAAVLALLLGGLGIHKFYLGYTTSGAIMLIVTIATLPIVYFPAVMLLALIEGIIYLTKSDEEFDLIYVQGKKEWL